MKKTRYSVVICFILCICMIASMAPSEAFARDDNPEGNTVAEFPTGQEKDSGEYKMDKNYGTVSAAKSPGEINYNYGTISSLQGATVGINCKDALINEAFAGSVKSNSGTINRATNTAVIEHNAVDGVIKENGSIVKDNFGTIEYHYGGTVGENYGSIGIVEVSAKVEQHIDGKIEENRGTVTVCPDSKGIITTPIIGTNTGKVTISEDPGNKSTVTIENNNGELIVNSGADCTVVNNTGKIDVKAGGACKIVGSNTGTASGAAIDYPITGEYYELILDNIDPKDFTILTNYKVESGKTYVIGDESGFKFICDDAKYAILWSDGGGVHFTDIPYLRTYYGKYVDDTNKKLTLHFHTADSYVSGVSPNTHIAMCKCGEEAFVNIPCSGGTATCVSKAVCEFCKQEYGALGEHSYGEWITEEEAKPGVAGKKYRVCSICKHREDGTIPAKPTGAPDPTGTPTGAPDPTGNPEPTETPVPSGAPGPSDTPSGGEEHPDKPSGGITAPTEKQIAANSIRLNKSFKVSSDDKGIGIGWEKVNGADGYIVYAGYCGKTLKKVATIKRADKVEYRLSTLKGEKIDLTKNFKVRVKAYKIVDGKKMTYGKTILAHVAGYGSKKYTNASKIKLVSGARLTLKAGDTFKIKAKTVMADKQRKALDNSHGKKFRYDSDNTSVAIVDEKGNITAVGSGKCTIYVYARNGYATKVNVIVNAKST